MRPALTFACQGLSKRMVRGNIRQLRNGRGETMAGEALHEDRETLGPDILDRHRAISTIMEELEAIDRYDQRIKASGNAELQAMLRHNRNEEKEHCSMLLEWLRRHDREFETHLRTYLFSEGPIREASAGDAIPATGGGLSIGSLKG